MSEEQRKGAAPSRALANSDAFQNAAVEPTSPSENRLHARPARDRDPARYQILAEHGRGGLGRVYRARDQELGRDVALKELLQLDHSSEVRFFREALITARLEHPGIVPVHDAGRWPDGTPYYSMKLVAGRSLAELLDETETLDERLALLPNLIAVADAMAYAHDRGIIHRDLKPSNVMVGRFGETIVIDWGIAKDLTIAGEDVVEEGPYRTPAEPERLTAIGAVLGTPAYMAPEQAVGEAVDARTDVYAIGMILYQLCCGTTSPFPSSQSAFEHSLRHIDRDLAAIARKALSIEPCGRYPDAGALAADLKAFESGARIAARRYSLMGLLRRWVNRHKRVSAGVAAAATMAAIAAFLSISQIISQRDELVLTTAEKSLPSDPEEAIRYLRSYQGSDGSRVRDIAADARARGIGILLDIERSNTVNSVSFLDDETLAYQSGRTTHVMSLVTGQDTRIEHAPAGLSYDLLADRSRVLPRLTEGTAPVVDLRQRRVVELPHPATVWDARFMPGGGHVITTSADGYIRRWNVDRQVVERAVRATTPVLRIDIHPDGKRMATCDADSRLRFGTVDDLAASGPEGRCVVDVLHGFVARFSPTGRYYATATPDGASLWTLDDMQERQLRGPNDRISDLSFSAAGTLLAAGSKDGSVYIWETASGTLVNMIRHSMPVLRAVWSTRANILATGDAGGTVVVTDLSSGRTSYLRGHGTAIRSLAFSPGGALLATADRSELRLWRLGSAETTELAGGPVLWIAGSASGRFIAALTVDATNTIRLWDLANRESGSRALSPAYVNTKSPIIFLGDRRVAFFDDEYRVRSWDLGLPGEQVAVSAMKDAVALAQASNGDALIGTNEGLVARWSGTGAETILGDVGEPVLGLRMLAGGSRVAVLSATGRVSTISQESATRKKVLGIHEGGGAVLLGVGGERIFTATSHEIRAWEPSKSGSTVALRSSADLLVATVSPSGDILAFGHGSSVHIREWQSGRERRIRGYGGTVNRLEFSPDGHFLAAAFADGAVRVLDLTTNGLAVHREHARPVYLLRFSADSAHLISGGYDHSLRIWSMSRARFQPVSPSLSDEEPPLTSRELHDRGRSTWRVTNAMERHGDD